MARRNGYVHLALALTSVLALVLSGCAAPEAPGASAKKEATGLILPEGGRYLRFQQVPMRDGIRLNADVWLPAAEGRFPTILIRTPYETEIGRRSEFLNQAITRGYAIMQSHERGRYLSEGEMGFLSRADEDGWDTLNWIAAQPWSDGKVATYGCSSSAENQLKLASLGHPAHKAMIAYSTGCGIAEVGPYREQGNFWRGGVWQQGWADYFFTYMALHWPQLPSGLPDSERQALLGIFSVDASGPGIAKDALDTARMHLPMIEIGKVVGAPETVMEEFLLRGPSHPSWDEDRVTSADVIHVPGLWAEALYDISAPSSVAFFEKTRAENPLGSQAMVITNGLHCRFYKLSKNQKIGDRDMGDMRFDFIGQELAWLDRWLKDDMEASMPLAPVTVYMGGVNHWAEFSAVPVAGRDPSRTFFLTSGGQANSLDGDGVLSGAAPSTAIADKFTYDPADPVISHGGAICCVGTDQKDGAFDQREIETRSDVLVYTSEELAEDLAVFGYIETELFVSSDAPDTDFTVRLVDVAPDGTAWNLCDTILRMRYREGLDNEVFMQSDETYGITLPPMLTANVFLRGHRIRVEVSSSNFPSYARNLNTADNPYTSTEVRVANNVIHHGPDMLSRIVMPVVRLK